MARGAMRVRKLCHRPSHDRGSLRVPIHRMFVSDLSLELLSSVMPTAGSNELSYVGGSPSGTSPTSSAVRFTVAIGGGADIGN